MENDEEFREITKKLDQFPNFFQMGAESTNFNRWEKVMQKLNDEKEDFEDMSKMDRFRNLNLFGCIQYYRGNLEAAESTILEVFKESNSTNINACAMMVKIYYIQCKIAQSKEMLQILHKLAKDPYKIDIAKGELCYAWSRIDPQHYKKGIDELQKLVSKYFDKPEYSIWAFGLALLYRRCLHLSVKSLHPDLDINHCFKSAKELFENNIQRDDIEPIYKARSYIELANLLALKDIFPEIKYRPDKEIYRLIMEGVALAPECASILMKAGKIMKYIREYLKSEAYLEKAYKLRPNSFNCHQLALIKKSNIIHANNRSNNTRSYQYAGGSQNSPQPSYRNIQKRQGQGSLKWQDNVRNQPTFSNATTHATLSPTNTLHQQPHRITVVQQLFKSEASSSKVPLDQQTEAMCISNNPDLEEDSAIQERCTPVGFEQRCGSHVLEDKIVSDFKIMALDDQNTNTKKFDLNINNTHVTNKDLSTTIASEGIMNSETIQKEAKPNYRSCPKQSIHASKSLDQPGKLSPHAEEFVPMQVQKQVTPQKPNSIEKVIKSPKLRYLSYHKSRQLNPCLQLFEESVKYSKGTNFSACYDWGLTILQMTPPNYKEALQKFNYVIQHCKSMDVRYKAYEQAGICLMKMSEDEKDKEREYHTKNAYEMFKKAIRCWANCQRMKIHDYFDNAEQNCDSLCSLREMIVGDASKQDTQKKKDVAHIYYLIRQYGPSLELYEELYNKLNQQDKDKDNEVIQGIITNRLELQQFDGVIDLLLIYMNSKEGVCSSEFKFKVLKKIMGYAIVKKDHILAKSVVELVEDINFTYDVMILYNENDPSSKEVGKCLGVWLGGIGLKVTYNIDDILYGQNKLDGQGIIIGRSKMAICILNNTCKCPELHQVMLMTIEGFHDGGRKILLLLINDSKRDDLADPFKPLDSLCVPTNSQIDQQRTNILNAFCDIYLAPKNSPI